MSKLKIKFDGEISTPRCDGSTAASMAGVDAAGNRYAILQSQAGLFAWNCSPDSDAVQAELVTEFEAAPSADEQISDIVKALAALHPDLGLSYGYIGNVYRNGDDDRSFRIFTNRVIDDQGRSVSYHLGGLNDLPRYLERIQDVGLDKWLALAKNCRRR